MFFLQVFSSLFFVQVWVLEEFRQFDEEWFLDLTFDWLGEEK